MNGEKHPHIVCAARGGRRIQPSLNRAIEIACEKDARLTLLYVLDVEFLKHTTLGHTELVFEELDKMGEFMMIRLCEYAREQGCTEPDYVIRHGKVREEIRAYLLETQPDLLVLGQPQSTPDEHGPPAFQMESLVEFARELTADTGVPVEIAESA